MHVWYTSKECNKRAAEALISTAYCVPRLSLGVRRAYPSVCAALIPRCAPRLSLGVRRTYPSVCAALIPRCAPRLSLGVRRTYPSVCATLIPRCAPRLSLGVCRTYPSVCAALIPQCAPHFNAIPESASSVKCRNPSCGTFPVKTRCTFRRIAAHWQKSRHVW